MSNFERMNLAAKVQQLVDLIVQAQPGKMSFESEEQFLAMLSLGSMPARAPVRQHSTQPVGAVSTATNVLTPAGRD